MQLRKDHETKDCQVMGIFVPIGFEAEKQQKLFNQSYKINFKPLVIYALRVTHVNTKVISGNRVHASLWLVHLA